MMSNLAYGLEKELEARGEYVVKANASSGWFAVFPTTWRQRTEAARREGRDGPNLVICKTKSPEARDHYVIPYSVIRDLVVEGTLSTTRGGGSFRWNLSVKNGELHVSHRVGNVDVAQYHGARLLVEKIGIGISDKVAADEALADYVRMQAEGAGPTSEVAALESAAGAGFGQSEQNRKVEEAAVNLVSETYRQEGWQVVSVEQIRCGFDLHCVRGKEEARVEAKGVAGADRRFVITAGELRCALEDDRFVLALVTSALSSRPVLERVAAHVFRETFRFEPIEYWANPVCR